MIWHLPHSSHFLDVYCHLFFYFYTTFHQKHLFEMFGIYNEESRLGEFNIHRAYQRQEESCKKPTWVIVNWLAPFNIFKTKLLTFYHHRAGPKFSPTMISGQTHNEAPGFEYWLWFRLTPDFNWNSYIWSIAKKYLKNGWFLVLHQKVPDSSCHALSFQESDQTKNGVLLPYLGWSCTILTFQALIEFKIVYVTFVIFNCFDQNIKKLWDT